MPRRDRGGKRPQKPQGKSRPGDPRADHFYRLAKEEGFAARSVYKLEEVDRKYRLFRSGMSVLDLGCHPGSWTQYASKAILPNGKLLGIDRLPMNSPASNATILTGDIFDLKDRPANLFPSGFDIVLSDMAPNTTGMRDVDEARSLELVEVAFSIAMIVLRRGGSFLFKIFFGPTTMEWIKSLKEHFAEHHIIRPEATRKESREVFVLCRRFNGKEPPVQPSADGDSSSGGLSK